jgi:ribonuclease HI
LRFEILLPLRFNDGTPVAGELVGQTILELRQQFNAISAETQVIRGHRQHQGEEFLDELARVFVDVADTPENYDFFVSYKEQPKTRFQQLDIWMTTYSIEVI